MSGFNVNDEVIHCREGLATIIGSKEMKKLCPNDTTIADIDSLYNEIIKWVKL